MAPFEQALCDSEKEKLPFHRMRPPAEPGEGYKYVRCLLMIKIRKVSNRFTNSARPYQTYCGHSPLISSRSYSPIPIERNPFHTTCLLSEYRFHFYNKICKAAAGCLGLLSETNLWLNMTPLLIFKLITPA